MFTFCIRTERHIKIVNHKMLYKEASRILQTIQDKRGSVKNLVLSSTFKNKKQLFALVCETLKYKPILKTIIENTKIQRHEKILKQDNLALVLIYDFLLGKKGFMGHTNNFKEAILKHQAALHSELARLKVKVGAQCNEDLLPNKVKEEVKLPRCIRVNTLKTCKEDVITHFKKDGYTQRFIKSGAGYDSYINSLGGLKNKQFLVDPYITDLLVFASGTDLHDHVLYHSGDIIFQDRASCIPAFVLSPPPGSHVIDCCAAPGNKTTHLAAIMANKGKLYAFDKDMKRAATLSTMVLKAGVLCAKCSHDDFLQTDPDDPEYRQVQYILVDPSCSGSGIVNRQNNLTDDDASSSVERLKSLAKFQVTILSHAMSFPNLKRIVYSTCSVHQSENEDVVNKVLKMTAGHFKLVSILKEYPNRGRKVTGPCDTFKPKRCLRLDPTNDLTNGFFVALFERIEGVDGSIQDLVSRSVKKEAAVSDDVQENRKDEIKKSASFSESDTSRRQKAEKRTGNKNTPDVKMVPKPKKPKNMNKSNGLQKPIQVQPSTSMKKQKRKNPRRKHKPVTA